MAVVSRIRFALTAIPPGRWEEAMSALRKMRRSVKKANGVALRRGPAKGTTGKVKGPARSPSLAEARAAARRQKLAEESVKSTLAAETKAA
jgi:hypothetical protein